MGVVPPDTFFHYTKLIACYSLTSMTFHQTSYCNPLPITWIRGFRNSHKRDTEFYYLHGICGNLVWISCTHCLQSGEVQCFLCTSRRWAASSPCFQPPLFLSSFQSWNEPLRAIFVFLYFFELAALRFLRANGVRLLFRPLFFLTTGDSPALLMLYMYVLLIHTACSVPVNTNDEAFITILSVQCTRTVHNTQVHRASNGNATTRVYSWLECILYKA